MTLTQLFTNIANAIRSKKGTSGTIVAENFPQEISSIVTPSLQSKSVNITQNGTTTVTPDSGYNGLDEVEITTNVEQDIVADMRSNPPTLTTSDTFLKYITKINNLDTTGITDMSNFFRTAISLETIPVLNTTSVISFSGMFDRAGRNLTDQSLDNILQMCINATSYTGTKKLSTLKLSSSYVPNLNTRIPNLPHYQDFLDAGWTIK